MVTDAEVKDFAAMINWIMKQDKYMNLRVTFFKQFNQTTKKYKNMVSINGLRSSACSYEIPTGDGESLTDAMKDLSKHL